ncbi:MAG: alkaline phosphatase D family protein [Microthrixaceae bacterium]
MYDRRTFLRRAALTGAGAALLPGLGRPAAAADDDLAPFLHGVASGDPTAASVILWTRVTPASGSTAAVPVAWRVARDIAMTDVVASGNASADQQHDFTVKVDATGLDPATYYFYEFETDGASSIIGRTKTAPSSASHLRFGVVSCSNYQGGFFNVYARLAERDDLDAIIHLGDYIYEYGNGDDRYGPGTGELSAARDHQPPTEMRSLTDYRLRHASYKLDPDLRRLHQLYPWITTWDDHESANNSHRDAAENHDPDTEGSWDLRKAHAQQAYSEWMPILAADPAKIYRTLRYGDLADIIVMDTRLDDRDPELGSTGALILSGEEVDDPARKMISVEQREMVFDALSRRDSQWKIVAQQVILGQWNAGGAPRLPVAADQPRLVARDGGNALNPDQWDGYPAERDRLFGHIRDNAVQDVVVLTGDVHTSWALDLTEDPYNPLSYNPATGEGALGVELVTPSVTSANFESLGPGGVAAFEAVTRADNPHVKFVDFDDHGYLILDLTPEQAQADWYFVDTVLSPSNAEHHAASWRAVTGDNHLTSASTPAPAGFAAPAAPGGTPRAVGTGAESAVRGKSLSRAGSGVAAVLPVTGPTVSTAGAAAALGAAALAARLIERRVRLADRGDVES